MIPATDAGVCIKKPCGDSDEGREEGFSEPLARMCLSLGRGCSRTGRPEL